MSVPVKKIRGPYKIKDKGPTEPTEPTIHPVIIQYTQIYGLDKAIRLINQRIQDLDDSMRLKPYLLILVKLMHNNYDVLIQYSPK